MRRRAYVWRDQQELCADALAFRNSFFEERGATYRWMQTFISKHFLVDGFATARGKAARLQVKSAIRCSQGWAEREQGRQGQRRMLWEKQVAPKVLRRRRGGGRIRHCPWLSEELCMVLAHRSPRGSRSNNLHSEADR